MKIASIKKTSLLDYPGKVSAIIGTQGCNMRCPWCHNFYLIPYDFGSDSTIIDEKEFYGFLGQRKGLLDGIVITGGEPTIQPDLPFFCGKIKEMGYLLKLDTNGTNPGVLHHLIKEDLVDYIAMDIKTDPNQYPKLFKEDMDATKIYESIDIILSLAKAYEFRTTCVRPFVTIDNIEKIVEPIKGSDNFFLQICNTTPRFSPHKKMGPIDKHKIMELKQKACAYVKNCEIR